MKVQSLNQEINDSVFVCQICDAKFTTKGNLQRHIRENRCSKSQKYSKKVKKELFNQKENGLVFICNSCGANFTMKSNLRRHVRLKRLELPRF